METTFTFRNVDATEPLEQRVTEKLARIKKYAVKPEDAHVIFKVENFNHTVEIVLRDNGNRYVSHQTSNDMYTSVDGAIKKLEEQLRRNKGRIKGHKGE